MAYQVFVSHGWADRWLAGQIVRRIQDDCQVETFMDAFDIAIGDDFEGRIFEAMTRCQELLVLLTPWSVDRNWVWVEIGAARALNRRIVAVLYGITLDDIDREKGGKTFLGAKNVADINEVEDYLMQLKRRVRETSHA